MGMLGIHNDVKNAVDQFWHWSAVKTFGALGSLVVGAVWGTAFPTRVLPTRFQLPHRTDDLCIFLCNHFPLLKSKVVIVGPFKQGKCCRTSH